MHYVDLGKTKSKPLKGSKPGRLKLLAVVVFLGIGVLLISKQSWSLASLLSPVSVFSKIINPQKVAMTDGRTNILLLAIDKRGTVDPRCGQSSGGSGLTDTIIVASIGLEGDESVFVSVPRDLWVETGYFSGKINSTYSAGGGGKSGAELVSRVIGGVLGIPIHYFVVVDFAGFEQAVDILGGLDVDVERSFDDYKYPVLGQECAENAGERWEHIHFDAGRQLMNGERALKFVRSRHAQGAEGSDFARSARQQLVLLAAKEKFLSLSAFSDWGKVKTLYQTFEGAVETDLSLWEMEKFYTLGRDIGDIRMTALNGQQGLLFVPEDKERFGGAWVIVPRAGDFSEVRAYVNELLFEE